MPLAAGTRLGPYEVTALIGEGGMGEVYRARDTRLNRIVAVKVLPTAFAADAERRARFEREAKAIAALSHPNILGIHDTGEHAAQLFVVTELLDGETLRDKVQTGALPIRKATEIAVQIARGLGAAHDKRIVHRDLKPENVFLLRDGQVKILDFGLARQVTSPTEVTATAGALTDPGTVMGTVGYMAPEQVRGQTTDARTDLFALGAVLYEMLSGQRAFKGDTTAETMTAILREDPPELTTTRSDLSPALDRIVRHCLEKDPDGRFQSARDVAFALETFTGTAASGSAPTDGGDSGPRAGLFSRLGLARVLATVGAFLLGAAALWVFERRGAGATPSPSPIRLTLRLPSDLNIQEGIVFPAVSPDGLRVSFSAANALGTSQIFVHNLTTGETLPLPGTEDGFVSAWSGDGRNLAFIANRAIKRTPASGGPVQTVCAMDGGAVIGSWLTWDTTDTLVFSTSTTGALWRVAASGGVPERISEPDAQAGELGHSYPRTLRDGGTLVFASTRKDRAGVALMARPAGGGPPIHIADSDGLGIPTARKRLLVARARSILALPWDDTGLAAAQGDVLANDLSGPLDPFSGASVGGDTLVYVARNSRVSLGWFDRNGRPLSTVPLEGAIGWPAVAPDDRRVAVDLRNPVTEVTELWLVDGDRRSKIAIGPTPSANAVWSPDGRRIAYESDVGRELRELTIDTNASRTLRRFDGLSDSVYPMDWSRDGRWIAYGSWREGNEDVWLYPTTPGAQPLQLTNTPFHEGSARFSPDSQFVAYRSSESGRPEVFLRALPPATERIPISTNGGAQPTWRGDGRELYYIRGDNVLMAVPIVLAPHVSQVSIGTATPLFKLQIAESTALAVRNHYDVTSNGQRFIVKSVIGGATLNVILNWWTGLDGAPMSK